MLQAAEKFAVQIGEILYRRKAWLEQESERLHPVRRFLGFAARQRQTEQIGAFIDMLSANLSLLESAFDTLRSPAMLTDIFGRVLLINAPMSDLGNMVGIDPYKMTALDVVARLSERDPGEIRKALTNVILHEDAIEFPATISVNTLGRSYILSVKAVRGLDRAVGIEANAPFSLYGLLVQLRDVSDPMDLINIRENFIEHSVSHIRKRLDSLLAICLKICDPSQKEAIKHSIFDELTKKKVAVEASMDELQMFMGFQESGRDIKYLPTDVRKLFDDAKSSIIDQAEAKQLTFLIESPDTSPIALAPPRELGEIFSIILSILIKDALQNTALSIRIREDDESVSYSLGSSGFGMRNEDLKAYMDPSFQDTPNEFHNLGILKTVLDDCYGSLTYQAVIGQGMTFMIKLTKSLSC
jgi:signal transduction histidine kinase